MLAMKIMMMMTMVMMRIMALMIMMMITMMRLITLMTMMKIMMTPVLFSYPSTRFINLCSAVIELDLDSLQEAKVSQARPALPTLASYCCRTPRRFSWWWSL